MNKNHRLDLPQKKGKITQESGKEKNGLHLAYSFFFSQDHVIPGTIQKPWKINQQMTPSSTNIFPLKAVITADTQGSRNLASKEKVMGV